MPQVGIRKKARSTTAPAKKRRKRKHYKTGIHHSPKCSTPIHYRSGWEKTVAEFLDSNPEVVSYEYESLMVPYVMAGRGHTYYPDFLVRYKSGRTVIVEVKRQDKLATKKVMLKNAAVRSWIIKEGKGWEFEVWTDAVVMGFRKLVDAKKAGC